MNKEKILKDTMSHFEELSTSEQKAMLRLFIDMYIADVEKLEDPSKTEEDKRMISCNIPNYEMVINLMTKQTLPDKIPMFPTLREHLLNEGKKLLESDKNKEELN
ncbi:MAG: hypothetical protein K6E21_03585 [Bacilli bacterium]|nr:hypothetical protein [Bacilli bacterium]